MERTFVQFMIQEKEKEAWAEYDYETVRENCDVGNLAVVYFTVAVKLAVEANNPKSDWHMKGYTNVWTYEVDAMLSAYMKTKYITEKEYCIFRNTFYKWMRANNRANRPFAIRREWK